MFPVRCIMGPLIRQVCLLTFLIILNLVVPPDPVDTSAGHDVILPCHLSPQTSAVDMEIRWFKEGEFDNPLYLYNGGKVKERKGYEGRVSVFTQELEKGNISLLLKNVMASERGSYKCQASYLDWIQELPVVLQVKQQGSVPRISMRKHLRGFIQLSCSSENWYPEPHMLWTDSSGKEITSAETERPKQKEGGVLYSITSHMRIGNDQLEGVTCVVMSQYQGTKMESTLQMTGEFRNFKSQLTVEMDVTFDPDTAHVKLSLSDDNKLRKEEATENLEEKRKGTKNKFKYNQCVLGMIGYDKGIHYWEDTEKRDNIQMYPENGFWSICYKDGELKTVEQSSTFLPIELKPEKLGVFVDYEGGQITFFNVEKKCHIHSFNGMFSKKLYPFFGPLIDCKEELKISPMVQKDKPSTSENCYDINKGSYLSPVQERAVSNVLYTQW
uniref:Ig-like domain-containing protein n=1 Tax=Hucho hucho TaxID=62062 RepID=A0A4W5P960_9TELE